LTNRIHLAINRATKLLESEDAQKLKDLSKKLDMTIQEHSRSQELKSLAQAEGKLTLDEATTVFNILGGNPSHFNSQSLAAKFTVTNLIRELLQAKVKTA
jgi:hypothetical protein